MQASTAAPRDELCFATPRAPDHAGNDNAGNDSGPRNKSVHSELHHEYRGEGPVNVMVNRKARASTSTNVANMRDITPPKVTAVTVEKGCPMAWRREGVAPRGGPRGRGAQLPGRGR